MVTTRDVAEFVKLIDNGITAENALAQLGISRTAQYSSNARALMDGLSREVVKSANSERLRAITQFGQVNPQLGEMARRCLQSVGNVGGKHAQEAVSLMRNLGGQGVKVVQGLETLARRGGGGAAQAMEELSFRAKFSEAARAALQRIGQSASPYAEQARKYWKELSSAGAGLVETGATTVGTMSASGLALCAAGLFAVAGAGAYVWSQSPELFNRVKATARGAADPKSHPDYEVGSRRVAPATAGQFVVVKLNGMGYGGRGIYSVRSVDEFEQGIPFRRLRHGGNSGEKAPCVKLSSPTSLEKATADLANRITAGSLNRAPLAGGMVGEIEGGFATIDDWGAASIDDLRLALGAK